MAVEIRVPEAGESITQVELARWLVGEGDWVEKDQEIAEIDSDKATLTISADEAGKISISVEEGTTVEPGKIIGQIDTSAQPPGGDKQSVKDDAGVSEPPASDAGEDGRKETAAIETPDKGDNDKKAAAGSPEAQDKQADKWSADEGYVTFSPQARKLMEEKGIYPDFNKIRPDGRRITKKDILAAIAGQFGAAGVNDPSRLPGHEEARTWGGTRQEERQKMSTLRKKVAERLVAVKNETAMLTTFNEADMSAIISLRKKYQHDFVEKYGFKLGFMSFFVKAVTESIPFFPQVNGYLDGSHIVVPGYADVGIAVSTPKGLMVPVIRNAEKQSIPELEHTISEMAERARNNKIKIEELQGGTISITNGGVFGSMLSTPIINPPQSAILGMHNIVERPVAIGGKVEIRPMMYLALSYDHRIIDGKESVSFLVKVKEYIENPARMLFRGKDPLESLIGVR